MSDKKKAQYFYLMKTNYKKKIGGSSLFWVPNNMAIQSKPNVESSLACVQIPINWTVFGGVIAKKMCNENNEIKLMNKRYTLRI